MKSEAKNPGVPSVPVAATMSALSGMNPSSAMEVTSAAEHASRNPSKGRSFPFIEKITDKITEAATMPMIEMKVSIQ